MTQAIIKVRDIFKSYKMGITKLDVLKGLDLDILEGEFVTITGASGSGKSTLLHLLGALDREDSGEIFYNDNSLGSFSSSKLNRYRNKEVGFVFQFYHLIDELNVLENVLMPAMAYHSTISWLGVKKTYQERALKLLDELGLKERLHHRPYQLSGGERQRVAIGRALINQPKVLLADEPTGNLDWNTGQDILAIFDELHQKHNQTIVMVTHDERVAKRSQRVVRIEAGKVID